MKKLYSVFLFLFLCVGFMSCSEDDNAQLGEIEIEFDNVVGDADLELNTSDEPYINSANQSYKVSTLRYYISNIKLKRSDGTIFTDEVLPDGSKGYYLIDESDGESQHLTLTKVPAGDYTEISFTIGVDADQVTEGAQTGPLDPAEGMFWSWNSGYIFVMLEGLSEDSSDPDKNILYHVGGYKSDPAVPSLVDNVRNKTVPMGSEPAMVRSDRTPEVHLIVDVNKFFASPNQINFTDTPVQHSPADNTKVADNYVNTFVVDHVHN
jgi:hypothetical protein